MDIDFNNISQEETPPEASAMINTFRAFGYNLRTAIADIIDNSISAKAENIWIEYKWDGADSWVTITDDGLGMKLDELKLAMTPGSRDPKDDREEHDLGRFGLGLKTSSFSQCKRLTVATKSEGFKVINRCWDLDYVNKTKKWSLLDYLSDKSLANKLEELNSGTTVIWEKMDRLVGNTNKNNEAAMNVFLDEFASVEDHLSLVFHRYMEQKRVTLYLNGNKLEPWDPFMKQSDGGQFVAHESLDKGQVSVKCYVLPHISKLTIEERKKAKTEEWYKLQGFYIYRQNRLLLHGDWLGLFSKNEHFKNARILIDIPNKLDHDWKIDIKKATATPSFNVRKDLIRLGKLTRSKAGSIHKFRGNQIMLDDTITSFDFQPIWKARKTRDESRHYYINQDHPIIKNLLEKETISKKEMKSVLRLIGETTPVESIIQFHSEEPESHELRDSAKELDQGTIEVATLMYKSLKSQGLNNQIAIKQIFNIEPFNQFPELEQYFN
ncbi:ATP-binding protein [Winogradskyella sp.]|jgi:anti-sigma regulatory factor (Ser/Thr protein kinase)|uniref:ATP-binding protein n=1 Tax=Winogradskyella sp. TaxID=1883156 RepID=UPI0025DDE885|nr:ATP-binding protein [Winogradskyella sp.]MCT4628292.1 ATP-binding protein [Winogradskyella sp.]